MNSIGRIRRLAGAYALATLCALAAVSTGTAAIAGVSSGATALPQLPANIALGMPEASLRAELPQLERVRRPRRSPGGAPGLWHTERVVASGQVYEETFFIDARGLQQVEWLLLDSPRAGGADSSATFAAVVQELTARYGAGLVAHSDTPGFVQESASWVAGDQDVIATRSGTPDAPTVRVVLRLRAMKDAGEL